MERVYTSQHELDATDKHRHRSSGHPRCEDIPAANQSPELQTEPKMKQKKEPEI